MALRTLRRGHHGLRRLGGNALGNAKSLVQFLACRHHFLHKVAAQGFGCIERVAGQQMQHGIAHAGALGHAQRGAARGHDAALHFHLCKAAAVGSDDDIGAQHQLYADGKADALTAATMGLVRRR
jgi:hypothetical protein